MSEFTQTVAAVLVGLTVGAGFMLGLGFVGDIGIPEDQQVGADETDLSQHGIERVVDVDAGVVCYIYDGSPNVHSGDTGFECMSLSETRLRTGGQP